MRGALSLGGRFVPICGMQIRHLQHLVPKRTLAPFAARSLASFKPNWSSLAPAQKTANVPEGEARGCEPPPQYEQSQAYTSPPAQAPGQIVPSTENQVQIRASLERLLSEPYLAIQRRLELANLLVGFEQANHYTLFNRNGEIVGYMAEDTSMGKTVVRNLLRTHRPFTATIFDPFGNILLRVSRPFYWITSSLFVTSSLHDPIGEVHMSWHLWRRRYSLYCDRAQFASIDAPLLSWEFTCEDEAGRALAAVDKNFAGLGTLIQTIFTDAHTYIVHLDPKSPLYDFSARLHYTSSAAPAAGAAEAAPALPAGWEKRTDPVGRAYYANDRTGQSQWGAPTPAQALPDGLVPAVPLGRDLSVAEKAVVLGCAISIDFDFFSRHSGGGGIPLPFFFPIGGGGGAADAGTAAGAGAGGAAAGAAEGAAGAGVGGGGAEGVGNGDAGGLWSGEGGGKTLDGEEVWGDGADPWKGGEGVAGGGEGGGLLDNLKDFVQDVWDNS